MLTLAVDTSAKSVSAALVEDGTLLAQYSQCCGLTHSRTLMPIVEGILKNTELTMADLDAVAVAAGPGSFTGIRIGVAAAKGLAFAADKPAVGVSTLEAMARNVAHVPGLVICAMDARRQQIYNALFEADAEGHLTRLTPDRAIALAELADELREDSRPKLVVGDGARLCRDYLEEAGIACRLAPPHLLLQNAASVGFAAEQAAREGRLGSAQDLQPVYLRPVQAKKLAERQN